MKHAFHKKVERKGGGSSWRHPSRNSPRSKTYLPTTTMTNEFAFILPRRSPGAGGSKSAAGMKMLCVFKSRPMVRALRFVGTFSTTVYLSGESSWLDFYSFRSQWLPMSACRIRKATLRPA